MCLASIWKQRDGRRNIICRELPRSISQAVHCAFIPVIGRHFGNRDHTTIMHSVKTVEKMIALEHQSKRDIEILTEKLG